MEFNKEFLNLELKCDTHGDYKKKYICVFPDCQIQHFECIECMNTDHAD